MQGRRPCVTVVIPSHDSGLYIEDALDSVGRQSVQPDEIILVADSTTDDSVDRAHASGLPIKFLQCNCKNAAAARNLGSRHATGEWLAFLDADDFWAPDYLEVAIANLRQSSAIAFLTHHDALYEPSGKVVSRDPVYALGRESLLTHRDFYAAFVGKNVGWPTSGMVVDRCRFEDVGGFDEALVRRHDAEMFMRLIYGHHWIYRPSAGWTYRLRLSGNISSNKSECAYYLLRALIKMEDNYQGEEMSAFIRRQAHKALSYNLRLEDGETFQRVCDIALSRVSAPYRAFYGLARRRPELFSELLNLRYRDGRGT